MPSSPFAAIDSALAPAPPAPRVAFLKARPFAHRGLHGRGVIENTPAAFRAAIAAGHGIELDVQASRDAVAMVFHDATLDRLSAERGPLSERTAAALGEVVVGGEGVATLEAVLALVASRVPLLIEVKASGRRVAPLCLSVRRALEGYRGDAGVMSFNPMVGAWFAAHAPHVLRGLVVSEERKRNLKGWAERRLSLWRSRAQFLAYDVRDLPSRFAGAQRARGLPVVTWTVRDAAAEARAAVHADEVIYEKP